MADFMLIAGAFAGGWYFDPVILMLEAAGHRAFAPTLPGLEPGSPRGVPVNLETHIRFVSDQLENLDSDEIVLVGHSYAGMVITGAAARDPRGISRLIYLDSLVPVAGQRVWDLIGPESREGFIAACNDGYMVEPIPLLKAIDPRSTPQPLATFLQPLDAPTEVLTMPRTFVWAERNPAFGAIRDRLLDDPDWECRSLPSGHDFVREARDALVELLLDIADSPRAD